MPDIQKRFRKDRTYIEQRLREGRLEDAPDQLDAIYPKEFEISLEEETQ